MMDDRRQSCHKLDWFYNALDSLKYGHILKIKRLYFIHLCYYSSIIKSPNSKLLAYYCQSTYTNVVQREWIFEMYFSYSQGKKYTYVIPTTQAVRKLSYFGLRNYTKKVMPCYWALDMLVEGFRAFQIDTISSHS